MFSYNNSEPSSRDESPCTTLSEVSSSREDDEEEENIWHTELHGQIRIRHGAPPSWERFYNPDHVAITEYLSEAGPQAFDAAIQLNQTRRGNEQGRQISPIVLEPTPFLHGLLQLGLGLESSIFESIDQHSFRPRFGIVSMTGLSPQLTDSLFRSIAIMGTYLRKLNSISKRIAMFKHSSSTHVAIAETLSLVVSSLRVYLNQGRSTRRTILQLQDFFQKSGVLLRHLEGLFKKLSKLDCDELILSELFRFSENSASYEPWIRSVVLGILARISTPWLDALSSCLGLKARNTVDNNICEVVEQMTRVYLDPMSNESSINRKMPCFFTEEEAETIFQIHHGLELLVKHDANHVLIDPQVREIIQPPKLKWEFGWSDISRVRERAENYHMRVIKALRNRGNALQKRSSLLARNCLSQEDLSGPYGRTQEDIAQNFATTLNRFEETPVSQRFLDNDSTIWDDVQDAVSKGLPGRRENSFPPPLSICPMFSFGPIISAQAKLVNRACMRMVFNQHDLMLHLSLQRRFHLMGDGIFASRLAQALFDPDLKSAERRKYQARSGVMGLRLGVRESWPPVGPEVRLALMGILTECFHNGIDSSVDLPGGLGFALREIPEQDIEKFKNPHSLQALDFLRLQYTAPPPLDAVITESALHKYDQIFKLLLRMSRLVFVVNQLPRDSVRFHRSHVDGIIAARFRFEAHHFVSTIAEYFLTVGIDSTWRSFEKTVVNISRNLENQDSSDHSEGIHQLRALHDVMLDRIMFALLLRRRQIPVMNLLEEIFELILLFAKESSAIPISRIEHDSSFKEMHLRFRKKVSLFITVCAGLSDRKAYGLNRGEDTSTHKPRLGKGTEESHDGNSLEQLLLKLQMNGWYERSANL